MRQEQKRLCFFAFIVIHVVWATLAYTELAKYLISGTLFARTIENHVYISDFANHYNAATLSRKCLSEKLNIYDVNTQTESLKKLMAPVVPELPFYLQYPPHFFLLVMPLSWLGINLAWGAWTVIGLTLAIWVTKRLCSQPFFDKRRTVAAILMMLSSYPAWLSVELGQTALYFFPAVGAMLLVLGTKRPLPAGILCAVSAIKLQYAPLLGLVGMFSGGAKFFASATISTAIMLVFSSLLFGPQIVLNYPASLLHGETSADISGVSAHMMQNIRGELILLIGQDGELARKLSMLFFVLTLGFVCWLWLFLKKQYRKPEHQAFKVFASLSILLMLASSLHCHTQDYLVAAIPILWLFEWSAEKSQPRARLIKWLCLSFPILSWVFLILNAVFQALAWQPFFCWALILSAATLQEIFAEIYATKQAAAPE